MDYPFRSHYVDVGDARLHYVDEGDGKPILFLHGNPTWSYVWRNVIPHVTPTARCVALDLAGMGRSSKPAIEYRFADHARYLECFVEALGLRDITLVLHDWGSALGFDYARRHPGNVRALACLEAMLAPIPGWDAFPETTRQTFQAFRTPRLGWALIAEQNLFIEQVLPAATLRALTEAERDAYRAPFPDEQSRKPIWAFANEIPIAGRPADVHEAVAAYSAWLQTSDLPKLLFHASPGASVTAPVVAWAKQRFPNLTTVDLGAGIHFLQEDHPHEIGEALARWLDV
ncbi:MAG TPA: haloalkane dehalogenase [Solirubrobacteraceae bacterium]|jgi:haloalkane dehalogenase